MTEEELSPSSSDSTDSKDRLENSLKESSEVEGREVEEEDA